MKAFYLILSLMSVSVFAAETQITTLKPLEFEQLFKGLNKVKTNTWENWDLKESEWEEYQTILEKTPWGFWEHTATPLQVLAIYSNNIDDMKRYARIEAKLDQWREEMTMKYQQIYNNEREIVHAQYKSIVLNKRPAIDNVKPGDQLLFFVDFEKDTGCDARCVAMMNRILKTQADVDIYFFDQPEQSDIFSWAKTAGVPVERVKAKQVTLNYETNQFNNVADLPKEFSDLPQLYLKTNTGFVKINL